MKSKFTLLTQIFYYCVNSFTLKSFLSIYFKYHLHTQLTTMFEYEREYLLKIKYLYSELNYFKNKISVFKKINLLTNTPLQTLMKDTDDLNDKTNQKNQCKQDNSFNEIKANISKHEGKIFEYICAISKQVPLFDNVSLNTKSKYDLPSHDCCSNSAGIDLFDSSNKIIYQCKYYLNARLTVNSLGTFLYTVLRLQNCGFKGVLLLNDSIKNSVKQVPNILNIEYINEEEYNIILSRAIYFVDPPKYRINEEN